MISISLTSGIEPRSLRSWLPSIYAVSTSGTSSGGSFQAAFPGDDFSKIRPSFWLIWRVALRVMCFIIYSFSPKSNISVVRLYEPVPPQAGQTPVPAQFWHFGWSELRCVFVPDPKHSAHFPSPPQETQAFLATIIGLLPAPQLPSYFAPSARCRRRGRPRYRSTSA